MIARSRASRGFTLIELMVVVGIIGVLSSVALPTFQRLTLRSKAAERYEIMQRIKKAVADYYLQHGNTYITGTTQLVGTPQPPTLPGSSKLMPNFKDPADGWIEIFRTSEEIMGALYYQYSFTTNDAVTPATLTVTANGDLDGDGVPNTWWIKYSRVDGAYLVIDPATDQSLPDDTL
ncbi:MAG: prepilin-type N-terminal cleavage/methylation domain-containing protein [Anaeromyxobacteraceae bacterium]